jgi:mannose-1-phosphate guanylyltransferase
MNNVTAIILGGGRGERLFPLTIKRAKPAVGFLGKYRLIDQSAFRKPPTLVLYLGHIFLIC